MKKLLTIIAVALAAGVLLVESGGHSRASAASAAGPVSTEAGRFTNYRAPTGPELSAAQAEAHAVSFARRAGQTGALTVTATHSTFALAHVVLMGEAPAEAQADEDAGPAERAEEMRTPVWTTEVTAASGVTFAPPNPVRRGQKAPSGKVMILVSDAHTGFVKEEYLGPTAPDLATMGPITTASIPAESAETQTASTSERLNPKEGAIEGDLNPPRVHWPVSIETVRHHLLATERSLAAGRETTAGAFSFRELEGTYIVSAPDCGSHKVKVVGRRTTKVVLHCAARR